MKANIKNVVDEVLKLRKKQKENDKIEVLVNVKTGNFSGHLWGNNCFYTASDLARNNDRHLSKEEYEEYYDAIIPELQAHEEL